MPNIQNNEPWIECWYIVIVSFKKTQQWQIIKWDGLTLSTSSPQRSYNADLLYRQKPSTLHGNSQSTAGKKKKKKNLWRVWESNEAEKFEIKLEPLSSTTWWTMFSGEREAGQCVQISQQVYSHSYNNTNGAHLKLCDPSIHYIKV